MTDNNIVVLEQEVEPIQTKISALVITDERTSKLATDYGAYISTVIKKADDLRKTINAPYEQTIKENNAKFSFIATLKEMKEQLRLKIMSFFEAERERQAKENVEKQKKLDEMAEKNGLPKVEIKIEEKRTVVSGIGKAHTTRRWTWKIVDEAKIPRDYLSVNEKKISDMVRAHTRTVAGISECDFKLDGVEVFQEETVSFRR